MPMDLKSSFQKQPEKPAQRDQKIEEYFQKKEQPIKQEEAQEEYIPEERNIGRILHQWEAPEFEVYEKSGQWYLIFAIFITAIVAYALITNSPLMAITFILIGVVGFIYLQKDPRTITFCITTQGVVADKDLYLYENIKSFWIFYDPPQDKTLSLHTNASTLPYVHIPIENEDPVVMRELLLPYVNEKKQDPSIINTLEKVFHI